MHSGPDPHTPARAEWALLQWCLTPATARTAEGRDRARELLDSKLDWDLFYKRAHDHGVLPQAHSTFAQMDTTSVPDELLGMLERHYFGNSRRNLRLMQTLVVLFEAFEKAGIDVIPYKGPLQATMLYSNLALRLILDLDLLVRKDDVLRVRDVMLELGFEAKHQYTEEEERHRLDESQAYDYIFVSADRQISVEVHWRLVARHSEFGLTHDEIWELAEPAELAGRRYLKLPRELMFVMICIHNEKHNWDTLRFISDAGHAIANCELDWARVLELARRINREDCVATTCMLARDLFGTPLASEIAGGAARQPRLIARTALIRARLFCEGEFVLPSFEDWASSFARLAESMCVKAVQPLRLLYLRAITSSEYKDRRHFPELPPAFRFLYLISRVARYIKWNYILRQSTPFER